MNQKLANGMMMWKGNGNTTTSFSLKGLEILYQERRGILFRKSEPANKQYTNQSIHIILWNMVSYIKGGMQTKGIWKQGPEANIWAQVGWEWGMETAPQWGTST